MPCQVDGTLDDLLPKVGQTTASLDDGAHQAGLNDGMTRHAFGVECVHCPDLPGVVDVGEPSLQPAGTYQVGGVVEHAGNLIKLGEPCTRFVAQPKPACLLAPGPPARARFAEIGVRAMGGGDRSGCHWLISS